MMWKPTVLRTCWNSRLQLAIFAQIVPWREG